VPQEIFDQAHAYYIARRELAEQKWSRKVDKAYPYMPAEDKTKISEHCFSDTLASKERRISIRVWTYVLDHYTDFKVLNWG